jgi:hypothetical protein
MDPSGQKFRKGRILTPFQKTRHLAGHSPDQDQVEGFAPSVSGDEGLVKGRVVAEEMGTGSFSAF